MENKKEENAALPPKTAREALLDVAQKWEDEYERLTLLYGSYAQTKLRAAYRLASQLLKEEAGGEPMRTQERKPTRAPHENPMPYVQLTAYWHAEDEAISIDLSDVRDGVLTLTPERARYLAGSLLGMARYFETTEVAE